MSAAMIETVTAWEALDSRGNPTVACGVRLRGGAEGEALAPSGASTGTFEALELRDGGDRYGGKGVLRAVANVVEHLAPAVVGLDASDQERLDHRLAEVDGEDRFSRLGANAALAVSLACLLAAARAADQPLHRFVADGAEPLLPLPMVNVVSGGAHAGGAIDVQDILVVPVGATSFAEAIHWCWRVRAATAAAMRDAGYETALVADEGGLAGPLRSNREALDLVTAGIEGAGLEPSRDAGIAIDVAANQLRDGTGYRLRTEGRALDAAGLVTELRDWCDRYPIVSLEDPVADEDAGGWKTASEVLADVQLLGDDLFVTDVRRLREGIETGVANAVLVKPNQTGTVSGARQVVDLARTGGYATVLSARSGETEDAWLADLAVGWGTGQIKVGSTMRSERTAKWNRLLRIEHDLADRARYAGRDALVAQRSGPGRPRPA